VWGLIDALSYGYTIPMLAIRHTSTSHEAFFRMPKLSSFGGLILKASMLKTKKGVPVPIDFCFEMCDISVMIEPTTKLRPKSCGPPRGREGTPAPVADMPTAGSLPHRQYDDEEEEEYEEEEEEDSDSYEYTTDRRRQTITPVAVIPTAVSRFDDYFSMTDPGEAVISTPMQSKHDDFDAYGKCVHICEGRVARTSKKNSQKREFLF